MRFKAQVMEDFIVLGWMTIGGVLAGLKVSDYL
jgi:hypothetical protein